MTNSETNKTQERTDPPKKAKWHGLGEPAEVSLIPEIWIPGVYVIISVLWIIFSDELMLILVDNDESLQSVSVAKGVLFVLLTGWLIALLMRSVLVKLRSNKIEIEGRARIMETLLETIDVGVVMVDSSSKDVILANRKTRELLNGWPSDSSPMCIDNSRRDFRHLDDRPYDAKDLPWNQAARGEVFSTEDFAISSTERPKRVIEVRGRPVAGAQNAIVAGLVTLTDITDRKIMESEIARHQSELEAVIADRTADLVVSERLTGLGHWLLEVKSGNMQWSQGLHHLLGSQEETCDLTVDHLIRHIHPDDRTRFSDQIDVVQKLGLFEPQNFRVFSKTNGNRILRQTGRVDVGRDGFPLRLLGTFQDVTESLKKENQLDNALNEAKASSAAKSVFLATLSHELRTPLNAILGLASLLEIAELDPEQLEQVKIISASGNALMDTINDILDYSKFESGNIEVRANRFDLREIVNEAVNIASSLVGAKNVEVTARFADGVPNFVVMDKIYFRQILINILSNSVKFTNSGSVGVFCELSNSAEQVWIVFRISDTGIGISGEDLKKVFDPFFQVKTDSSAIYKGTGLGLAITGKLVNAMKGTISISSELGVGTTFELRIPLLADTMQFDTQRELLRMPPRINSHIGENKATGAPRVLLVDDNPMILKVVASLLKKIGATSVLANNGESALEVLKNQYFDVIIVDMQMPGMDGLEVVKTVRNHESQASTRSRIIAFSANTDQSNVDAFAAAGTDDFIAKPVTLEMIHRAVYP